MLKPAFAGRKYGHRSPTKRRTEHQENEETIQQSKCNYALAASTAIAAAAVTKS